MSLEQKMGTNMADEHLMKEVGRLKDRFPKLDNMYLLDALIEKKGHAGKATQAIFKAGGEGVKEAEEQFYKVYSGAFIDRIITELKMVYLWNIDYDASFSRNRKSIKSVNKDGEEEEFFKLDSFLFTPGDPRYENHNYFDSLASKGDSVYDPCEWGTDPNVIYDENHPLNEKGVVMTIHELKVILHVWKYPLLGIHPYTDEDGNRCNYFGKEVKNRVKKELPEGWYRSPCKEYNGLWCYTNKEENIVLWKNPSE